MCTLLTRNIFSLTASTRRSAIATLLLSLLQFHVPCLVNVILFYVSDEIMVGETTNCALYIAQADLKSHKFRTFKQNGNKTISRNIFVHLKKRHDKVAMC